MNHQTSAYQITVLNLVFSSWEWLALFAFSFCFINTPNGGKLTAIAILSNSIVRLLASTTLSKFSSKFSERNSLISSFYARCAFLLVTFAIPVFSSHPILLLVWLLLSNIITVYDSYATFNLKYLFAEHSKFNLTQQSSLLNLGRRGALILTSYLAFSLKNNWPVLSLICIVIIACGIISSLLSIKFYDSLKINQNKQPCVDNATPLKNKKRPSISLSAETAFLASLLFLMNLMFGSGSILLIRAINTYNLILSSGITILTVFYSGFVLVNIFGIIKSKFFETKSSLPNLVILYIMTAVFGVLIPALSGNLILCALLTFLQGITYGCTLLIFNNILLNSIQGAFQNELGAKIDSWGRAGFILSQLGTGLLIDRGIDAMTLMAVFNLSSIPLLYIVQLIFKIRNIRICKMQAFTQK